MAYVFETSQRDDIFIARVGGYRHEAVGDNFDSLWLFWAGVASEMKKRGLRELLALVAPRGDLRTLDVRTFYRRLGEMGFMTHMRLAIVHVAHSSPVVRLGVASAAQDGWTIALFASEADAVAWLSSELAD